MLCIVVIMHSGTNAIWDIYNLKCLIKIISIKLNRDNYQCELMNWVLMEITAWPGGILCISFMAPTITRTYLRTLSTLASINASIMARSIKRKSNLLICIRCFSLRNSSRRIQLRATQVIPLILINRMCSRKVLQRARTELNSKQ